MRSLLEGEGESSIFVGRLSIGIRAGREPGRPEGGKHREVVRAVWNGVLMPSRIV
jgi:hypothetical protein